MEFISKSQIKTKDCPPNTKNKNISNVKAILK